MQTHCQYFDDADSGLPYNHAACPNPVAAHVEPKPVGQFAPVALCLEHVFPWTRDLSNLSDDWSITAVSVEAARALGNLA